MNIRIIKNAHKIKGHLYNGSFILEKEYEPSEYEGINTVRYFMYKPEENERTELLSCKKKYDVYKIKCLDKKTDNLYFTTITETGNENQSITMYRYNISSKETEVIYSVKEHISEYNNYRRTRVFVLNDFYMLFQNEYIRYNLTETYNGYFEFDQFLYCIKDEKRVPVVDEDLRTNGIENIKLFDNNKCLIKTGFNLITDERYSKMEKNEVSFERISFVNLGQLVSEILLSKGNIAVDTIDQAFYTETFPYAVVKGKYIIYSKVEIEKHQEQVIFYNTETKETTTCINQNIYTQDDLAWSYIIGQTPYIRLKIKGETRFYNLIKNKVDISFSPEKTVETVVNDMFIVSGIKKRFIGKEKPNIAVYRYPDLTLLHQEKGEYMGCIATDRSSIYILKN